jgi:hypothetical protein
MSIFFAGWWIRVAGEKKKKKVEMRKWPAVCIELFAYWTLERHRHISSSSL